MALTTDIPADRAQDPWVKIVGFLQQNWAVVIEREDDILVIFYGDTCGVFDEIAFETVQEAEASLRRNGFTKYSEDKEKQGFIRLPRGEFMEMRHPGWRESIRAASIG